MIAAYFTRVGRVDTLAADNKAELGTLPRPADATETPTQLVECGFGSLPIRAEFFRHSIANIWTWTKTGQYSATAVRNTGEKVAGEMHFSLDESVFVLQ